VWARDWALPHSPPSDYAFLVDRLVDRATLHRAEALAKKWGVLPHAVMIANGWLSESDYYRALARASGVPFQDDIAPHEVTAPASLKSPRECLARGLLKRCAQHGAYVFAPERLRPSTVEHVPAQLEPHRISLATPQAVRDAIRGHFAKSFATVAVDGLHARHPKRSAKEKLALWQRLTICFIPLAFTAALAFEAWGTLRALSLALTFIFLPAIALRVFAAYTLRHGQCRDAGSAPARLPDSELPVYTLLVPLYREANMLAGLTRALSRLDYPAAKLKERVRLAHEGRRVEPAR
jgi:hypothetical protein